MFSVVFKPALECGDTECFKSVAGKVMLDLSLFPKVVILGSCWFRQNGADDLIAFERNPLSNVFFHEFFSFFKVFGNRASITAVDGL